MIQFGEWSGMTAVVMASGPSMCIEDAERVREWQSADPENRISIAVSGTFLMAHWATYGYSNDDDFIDVYLPKIKAGFCGTFICGHPDWAGDAFIHHIPFDKDATGLRSNKERHISWGMNSGAAAISLAHFMGAQRIILLGFDQKWEGDKPRWHGRHPAQLQNQKPGFHRWANWFEQAAIDAKELGIEIVNCSRQTTLTCFERKTIQEALAC